MSVLFLNCVNFVLELHLCTYVHFVDQYIIIKLSSGQNTQTLISYCTHFWFHQHYLFLLLMNITAILKQ